MEYRRPHYITQSNAAAAAACLGASTGRCGQNLENSGK